jgi:hypothetical protein
MKDKNRIIIPTGHEPEEGLETPHFDAEETLLAARPVVPLTEEARETAERVRAEEFSSRPVTRRMPILALIIIAAVSVGLASGLAIGLYQGRQKTAAAPVAAQSPSTVDTQFKQKPAPETTQPQLPAVQTVADTEQGQTGPEALSVPEGDPMTGEETETKAAPEASDKQKPERSIKPDKRGEDEKQSDTAPAPERRKPQGLRDNDDGPKKQKLPRRRPAVDEDTEDIPRTVERANRELNRIREIFEGPRP